MKMQKEAQLNFSFAWIFAIIVGAFILFLALYSSVKIKDVGETAVGAKTGKEISVLLNPLETGFETGLVVLLKMPVETRIQNDCDLFSEFGSQQISIEQKSFGNWQEANVSVNFPNKYIFSEEVSEGQNFYLFSKPFEFPYKVSDVIYLTSTDREYCFVDAPEKITDELSDLKQDNIQVGRLSNCTEDSIKVCFGNNQCDVNVNTNMKTVKKRNQVSYYETDSLMYAAIFADKEVYECQVQRLMKRTGELAYLYDKKALLTAQQGCPISINMLNLADVANYANESGSLVFVANAAEEVERQNNAAVCKLW